MVSRPKYGLNRVSSFQSYTAGLPKGAILVVTNANMSVQMLDRISEQHGQSDLKYLQELNSENLKGRTRSGLPHSLSNQAASYPNPKSTSLPRY